MFKRVFLAVAFVILVLALACLYVGGVASFSDRLAHFLRPGPKLAPPGTAAGVEGWELFAETAHFRYYVRPGDHIPRWAMELAEDHQFAASRALQISSPSIIHYYKHPSQLDLYEATGSRSTGIVLTSEEGLATAFGWDWTPGETDVHQRAALLLEEGRLVPLQRLLANWDFRSYKSYPAYTAAGSFTKYLLAEYGPQKLSKLFELDTYSPRDDIEDCFATAYGKNIYEVEESWRTALQRGTLVATFEPPAPQTTHTAVAASGIILLTATFLGAVVLIVAGEKVADAAILRMRDLGLTIRRLLRWGAHE
jgi:hypothetical protein